MREFKSTGKLLVGVLAVAMALVIALPSAAFASGGGSSSKDMGASWAIPTKPMTNTVKKADGKTYKVVTTWAMAWSTSGPDFLGVNNSSFYGNGGNGNANVTSTEIGSTQTLLGIWASEANESPNAFNWNSFYNLYADEQTAAGSAVEKTDLACTTASWDTSSGVYGPFKYRPEIIWLCNNLSAAQTEEYVGYINQGKYVASEDQISKDEQGNTTIADPTAEQKAAFYVDGDETYNPYIIQPVNDNAFAFVESAYELAGLVDKVVADTASNGQLADADINWRTMNSLPRATRYNETAQECALNVEMLARGSVYYTLSKIADGTVPRKTVAYVNAKPGTVDDTHVAITVMDYMENIGGMGLNGTASWSPLVVNQLGQDGKLDVYNNTDHAVTSAGPSTGSATQISRPTVTHSYYIASADDLLSCDVLFEGRNTNFAVADFREWLKTNATTEALKAKADTITIIEGFPYVCNGSNFTMDKLIYGAYSMDCIYPELFPTMENTTFWYNKVYHIKNSMLGSAMSWALAVATLPANQALPTTEQGMAYDVSATIAKYDAGLAYYQANSAKDETIVRILANKDLAGNTSVVSGEETKQYAYTNFGPTQSWIDAAAQRGSSDTPTPTPAVTKKANTIKVTGKKVTLKAKNLKKKAQNITKAKAYTVKNAKGTLSYKLGGVVKAKFKKYFKVNAKNGKITVKKGLKKGTYKVKVKITAKGNSSFKSGTKTATVTVKVK